VAFATPISVDAHLHLQLASPRVNGPNDTVPQNGRPLLSHPESSALFGIASDTKSEKAGPNWSDMHLKALKLDVIVSDKS
jgi:hypothetical protein